MKRALHVSAGIAIGYCLCRMRRRVDWEAIERHYIGTLTAR